MILVYSVCRVGGEGCEEKWGGGEVEQVPGGLEQSFTFTTDWNDV